MSKLLQFTGGCHCGAVRFAVQTSPEVDVIDDCNCSICRKKGFLHLIVPPERFELLSGADNLHTYTFNTHTAKHHFCKTCGIHSFYTPRSHPDHVDVNVNCLDEAIAEQFTINQFDGKNWETNITELRDR